MHVKSVIILILFFALSCHNSKEAQESGVTFEATSFDTTATNEGNGGVSIALNYSGVVRDKSKNDGCGWMIELDLGNGEILLLEPLRLDENYQVDGKPITFRYTDSRRQSKCSLPSKPITIDSIIE